MNLKILICACFCYLVKQYDVVLCMFCANIKKIKAKINLVHGFKINILYSMKEGEE